VPVQCQCSASAVPVQTRRLRLPWLQTTGGGRPLERPPWSMLNRRSRASRGMNGGLQRAGTVYGAWSHCLDNAGRCEPADTHIVPLRRASSCQYALRRAAAGTSLITKGAILYRAQPFSTNHSLRAHTSPTWPTNRSLAADMSGTSLDPAVLLPEPASPRSIRCRRHQHRTPTHPLQVHGHASRSVLNTRPCDIALVRGRAHSLKPV
jgi:hypothetical protein